MTDLKTFGVVVVALFTVWLVAFIVELTWKRRKMPPGPFPLPILGNFLQMYSEGLVPWLVKMSEKYGPVYTIYWGPKPTVVLCGYETVKEALVDQGDVFLGRGRLPMSERLLDNSDNETDVLRSGVKMSTIRDKLYFCKFPFSKVGLLEPWMLERSEEHGLSLSNGESWKQLRQFSLLTLRDLGMGRKKLEESIQREAQMTVDHFRKYNGQPVDPVTTFSCASGNIITSILINTRHDFSDEKWMKILHEMQEGFTIFSSIWGQLYHMFPNFMRFIPGPHNLMFKYCKGTEDILKERIKNNVKTLDPSCPRDYSDCFFIKMEQEKQNPTTVFTMTNLIETVHDMFLGGSETTSLTLLFGMLIFIKYPDIQEKLHKEIDQVIGRIREPEMEDRSKMHYMNAVIHEILRYADVFPIGFLRAVTKDTVFHGYHIPKGTDVIPLLTTVLRDKSLFETPGEINVNHFLDENGKFKKNNGFLPFSAGKRSCIGESLVRMELFIFFTKILQTFTVKPTVNPKDLDISPIASSMENVPPVHKVMFIPRE